MTNSYFQINRTKYGDYNLTLPDVSLYTHRLSDYGYPQVKVWKYLWQAKLKAYLLKRKYAKFDKYLKDRSQKDVARIYL